MVDGGEERVWATGMGRDKDLVLSLLCTFGSWYNSSGHAEKHSRLSYQANASDNLQRQVDLFTREWQIFLPPQNARLLQVCPIMGFLAASLVTPIILARIITR